MPKPIWEDVVRIKQTAPAEMRPGEVGDVCGFREIETEEVAREWNAAVGTVLYLIEYGDGSSQEIHEKWIEHMTDAVE